MLFLPPVLRCRQSAVSPHLAVAVKANPYTTGHVRFPRRAKLPPDRAAVRAHSNHLVVGEVAA